MNSNWLCLILLFYLTIFFYISCNEVCTSDKEGNCKELDINKYSKEANKKFFAYFEAIHKAQLLYEPCNSTKCRCHLKVIHNDLKQFKDGITREMINSVKSKGTKYQIINNRLYRDKDCMFPARCSGVEHFLLQLVPSLPDTEFIVNTRDWPQIHKNYGFFGPVFSFSKTNDYFDIMYPAWAFWEGGPAIELYPRGIGRWDMHRIQLARVANETPWENKIEKAFFRGSRTSSERDPLVLLYREFPDLADAQYTKNQAWKSDADTLHSPPAPEVSFAEHCKYKYLFNFRGVAASFRLKHILLCKSLVFHVGNEWLEFFYPALKPWIHYIPVDSNVSKTKLKEMIEFVKENDSIGKKIAKNGYDMIWENLKMDDVIYYWKKLLSKYAELLKYKVEHDMSLIEIKK